MHQETDKQQRGQHQQHDDGHWQGHQTGEDKNQFDQMGHVVRREV